MDDKTANAFAETYRKTLDDVRDALLAMDTAGHHVMAWDTGLAVNMVAPGKPAACGIASGVATLYTDAEAARMKREGFLPVVNGHGEAAQLVPLAEAVAWAMKGNEAAREALANA